MKSEKWITLIIIRICNIDFYNYIIRAIFIITSLQQICNKQICFYLTKNIIIHVYYSIFLQLFYVLRVIYI